MSPAGTEIDGFQHRLASMANGTDMAPLTSTPSMTGGDGPPAGKASTAVVGVSSTSTSAKSAATSASSRARCTSERA